MARPSGSEEKLYRFGEAHRKAASEPGPVSSNNEFERAFWFEGKHFPHDEIFQDSRQYHLWAAYLIEASRKIEDHLDKLVNEVVTAGDSWWDEQSRRRVVNSLGSLLARRGSIRELGREAEVFMNAVAAVSFVHGIEHQVAVSALGETLRQIHETYGRAFDLCNLKLTAIWSRRLTYANLAIGVTALFVAIFALFRP